MTVRDFQAADQQSYFKMAKDFYAGDATLFEIKDEYLEDTFQQIMEKSPYVRGLLLEQEGELAGYSILAFHWSSEAGGMVLLLEEIYIQERFRGHGLGSQFMDWLFTEYQDKISRFRLEVCPHNLRVKRLYESYGFEVLDYIQMIK